MTNHKSTMPTVIKSPSVAELAAMLGSAEGVWTGIVDAIKAQFASLDLQWKPSKSDFGRICLVQHKKRTLVYLTPEKEAVLVAIVLGERAYGLAMASSIPAKIKTLFSEARPYAEGRGIRFLVKSTRDIPVVAKLVEIKVTPK
jgi:Protein of unknown function (DUF3788)